MNHIKRVMIDFETSSSEKNAGILTIGAVEFGSSAALISNQKFYARASLASNEKRGLHVSKETMEWWNKQDPQMREEAFGGTADIADVLLNFESWCRRYISDDVKELELWSRGAGFDCEILQHAFYHIHGYYPFDFRKHMCQRTIERLMPEWLKSDVPPNTEKHNALADAIYQAALMNAALNSLSWNDPYGATSLSWNDPYGAKY